MSVTPLRRLRAPQENGAVLAMPPLAEIGRFLADNRNRFNQSGPNLLGRSLADLRKQAQQEARAAAQEYLIRAGEPLPSFKGTSLFVAGHQPDLFHPGVWIKNFALNGLAKSYDATPLNLIVDSDAAKATSIRVPALIDSKDAKADGKEIDPERVKLLTIPIDRWTREVPYEELRVTDEATFANVENAVTSALEVWGFPSMFASFWQIVLNHARRTDILGERLAAARRDLERKWSCHNWELPVSCLCRTPSFARFACHLVEDLPRFQEIYNGSVRDYRKRYGLRSRSHPVPELGAQNGWWETPFWAWRAEQPRRRPLWARSDNLVTKLRLEDDVVGEFPISRDSSASRTDQVVAAWLQLETKGIRIRSRALMTTLFARLFLGDLFIHGIGGGKYDKLTDEIIRRFYGVEPPSYMILSGTLHLPLLPFPTRAEDCQKLARELRDLHWNPQRHFDGELSVKQIKAEIHSLANQKAEWIAREASSSPERRQRFHKLRELTEKLRPVIRDEEKGLEEELGICRRSVQANRILQSREYAFCLHPEETLRPFCTQFLQQSVVSGP